MNTLSQNSYECLSGSVLKVIAAVSMLIDHFAVTILANDPEAFIPYFYFLDTPHRTLPIIQRLRPSRFSNFLFSHDRRLCTYQKQNTVRPQPAVLCSSLRDPLQYYDERPGKFSKAKYPVHTFAGFFGSVGPRTVCRQCMASDSVRGQLHVGCLFLSHGL